MEWLKKAIARFYPEIASGYHLSRFALVQRIPSSVADGQLSTEEEPRYAVDVVLLDKFGNKTETVYESVPLPVDSSGHSRGQFGFPNVGTRVLIEFAYGSPAHPVITNIYPTNLHLPAIDEKEVLIQRSAATFIRMTQTEDIDLRSRNKARFGNADVDIVSELHRLAELLEKHVHIPNSIPKNHTVIADVKDQVAQVKT